MQWKEKRMSFHKAVRNLKIILGAIVLIILSSFLLTPGLLAASKIGVLSFKTKTKVIKFGKPLYFKGRLLNHSRRPISGRLVTLERKEVKRVVKKIHGKKKRVKRYYWHKLGRKKTNAHGYYAFGLRPKKSATYRVRSTIYTTKARISVNSQTITGKVFAANHRRWRKKPRRRIIPTPAPEPVTVPSAPLIGVGQALSSSSIRFNYIDAASNEVGFKIHDQNHVARITNSVALFGTGLSGYLDATGLSVNTQYTGHAHAYNNAGDSAGSGSASVYTLANTPSAPTTSSPTTSSLKVVVGQNSNPTNTTYSIYNNTALKYVQANGSLASTEVYQTYSAWGGSNGVTNTGLTENTSYTYKVKAKNGDGIATAFGANSAAVSTSASAPPPPPPPPPSSTMADRIGFAVGNHLVSKSDAELASQLDGMAAIGVKWIRHDMQWSSIQASGPSSYNWSSYDRLVIEANKRGIKILPILTYTPSWARVSSASSSMFAQPANNDWFAAFANNAVKHYAPMGIHAYEIWNEPNIPAFWQPSPNVSAYTDLLKKTYVAIKQADPSAIVVSGGLSPAVTQNGRISPRDFLSGMYANGVKGYFDKLGHHPYTFPALPSSYYEWSAWSQMNDTNPSLRSIMAANGDSKPIWGTEFGAPTNGMSGVSESLQAQTIEAAANLMKDRPWLEKLFIYSYKDIGTSTSTIENFFGVVRYNGSYKPGYYSVKNILAQ